MASEDQDQTPEEARTPGGASREPEGSPAAAASSRPPEAEPTLDQETLDALLAAETGKPSSLLDNTMLSERDPLSDDPIVERGDSMLSEEEEVSGAMLGAALPEDLGTAPLSQEALDALIAGEAGEAEAAAGPAPASAEETEAGFGLSQADLDLLIAAAGTSEEEPAGQNAEPPERVAETDAPHAAPEFKKDQSLAQADLDALLAEAQEPAVDAGAEPPLNQADLDELLAAQADAKAPAEESPDNSEEDSPLSQEDLDALMAAETEERVKAAVPEKESAADEPLSQEALDALLSAEAEAAAAEPAEPAKDEPLSQGDLDALLAAQTGPAHPPAAGEADATLNQDDLDALIAAQGAQPEAAVDGAAETPPAESGDSEEGLTQSALDALIQGMGEAEPEAPTESAESAGGGLSQRDLDALLASMNQPPKTEAAAPGEAPLSQDAIDALMGGGDSGEAVGLSDDEVASIDAATSTPPLKPESVDSGLTQNDIEALLAEAQQEGPSDPAIESLLTDTAAAAEEDAGAISQDMIDQIISGAKGKKDAEAVGSENLAAAATTPESDKGLISQSDLDALIEQSKARDKERQRSKQEALADALRAAKERPPAMAEDEAPPPAPAPAPLRVKKPSRLGPLFRRYGVRLAASLLVGVLAGTGMFAALYEFRESVPPMEALGAAVADQLRIAMDEAKSAMDEGDYLLAEEILDTALTDAPPSSLRDDARFQLLEARCLAFRPQDKNTPKFLELQGDIAIAIDAAPHHARVPEALYWSAKLYELDDRFLYKARDLYRRLMDDYPDMERADVVLHDAAALALELPTPDPASAYQLAQRLLSEHPGSPLAGDARLIIGDAYAMAGQTGDARTIYLKLAEANADTALGAKAYLRVARLAYDERNYRGAIQNLESRLRMAATTAGNDEVYLLLGKAQHRLGELGAAYNTLTDLVNFFPETKTTAQALIELSRIAYEQGNKEQALARAREAVTRFPGNPDALENNGNLQGLAGNSLRAAEALAAADEAGANDPSILLTAARHYEAAGRPDDALRTFDNLKARYPTAPQTVQGGVEAARLLYRAGRPNEAIERLDTLDRTAKGTEQHARVLGAMLDIYADLGLHGRLSPLARRLTLETTDPELLASAAEGLANAGAAGQKDALDEAAALYDRIDRARLSAPSAHKLMAALGDALLSADPARGLGLLEQAYLSYPQARTRESEQRLLHAYLNANRGNDARRMVMELAARVREHPADAPYLIDAATAWGDYLFDAGDYRLAADAFKLAMDAAAGGGRAVQGMTTDPAWAKFQRANALLKLNDYEGSLVLYDELARTNTPWAAEAGIKAKFARLEQQRMGFSPAAAGRS